MTDIPEPKSPEASGGQTSDVLREQSGDTRRVGPDVVRRGLLRVGASAPVLITFAGRPAWAASCSESGQMSAQLAGNMVSGAPCVGDEGCTPGFWMNAGNSIWHDKYTPDSHFHTVFPHSQSGFALAPGGHTIFNGTMRQVASLSIAPLLPPSWTGGAGSFKAFGAHAVAALQNAATNVDYALEVWQVFVEFGLAIQLAWQAQSNDAARSAIDNGKAIFEGFNERGCPVDMHGNFTS
jgi:hypothetical protein